MKKQHSFAFSAFLMGIIILISKLMGLLRDVSVARIWGSSEFAVAYETASKLPLTVFDFVLGSAVTSAFIPIYNSVMVKKGKKSALDFASSYINLILLITAGIALIGEVFAPMLVNFIAPDLAESTSALAVNLTRIMFPMVIFVGLAFTFVGFLQSEGEFNLPAVISLVSNAIMIGYLLFLSDKYGVIGLSVAMLVGWASQALVQLPSAVKRGIKYSPLSPINTPEIKRAARNTLPILAATWTSPLCSLINTRVASGIEEGRAIAALGYANKLYIIIVGLFSFVATNLLFPYFAKSAASGNTDESDKLTRLSIRTLTFIILPISAGVAILSKPFISLIYENGVFNSTDTQMTAAALTAYSFGMVFASISEILTKAFFAVEKTKIPMYSSLISVVVNILAVALFKDKLTVSGVAGITALVSAVNMAVNLICAIKLNLIKPQKTDGIDISKSALSTALMSAAIIIFVNLVQLNGKLLQLIIPTIVGIAIYALSSILLKSSEMTTVLNAAKSIIHKSNKPKEENDD